MQNNETTINHSDAISELKEVQTIDPVVHISEACENDGVYTEPQSIGYPAFDGKVVENNGMLGGVRAGDLAVVTGLSGQGKTTFLQNISVNLSQSLCPTIWFSYEVIMDNLYAKFKNMGGNEEDFLIYTPKKNTTGQLDWIKEKIREGQEKFNTQYVFIDHLDYLTPTNLRTSDQHRMVLKQICTELKNLAIDLEVSIFLVAHVKKVQGREVEMQDIAESSGIYQLADFVFCVERKTEIMMLGGQKSEQFTDLSSVRMLKNRITGDLGKMEFRLNRNNIIVPL